MLVLTNGTAPASRRSLTIVESVVSGFPTHADMPQVESQPEMPIV